jgi:hypothetical protein
LDRKVEAAIPAPPRVETRRNPNDEQLAQVLDITPKVEPEKNDAKPILTLECIST